MLAAALTLCSAGCPEAPQSQEGSVPVYQLALQVEKRREPKPAPIATGITADPVASTVTPDPTTDWSTACMDHTKSRPRFRRKEQRRTKQLLRHFQRTVGASSDMFKLTALAAMRETSMQGSQSRFDGQGVIHRLNPDVEGAYRAWRRLAKRYADNPQYDDVELWYGGAGVFGMNRALWLSVFDKTANPAVLCDTVVDLVVLYRAAYYKLRKLRGPIRCKGEMVRVRPTWRNLHRALFAGKLCPANGPNAEYYQRAFGRRAARVGLDPDAEVDFKDIGKSPGGMTRYELVAHVWETFEEAA